MYNIHKSQFSQSQNKHIKCKSVNTYVLCEIATIISGLFGIIGKEKKEITCKKGPSVYSSNLLPTKAYNKNKNTRLNLR